MSDLTPTNQSLILNISGVSGGYFNTTTDSSSPPSVRRTIVFTTCVVLVGSIGTVANGLVLWIVSKLKATANKTINTFTMNQLILDLYSCIALVLTYSWKVTGLTPDGTLGHAMCILFGSEMILWIGLNGSISNLIFITMERYAKIVFPIFHRKFYPNWMTYVCMLFSWIIGILTNVPTTLISTTFSGGTCLPFSNWPTDGDGVASGLYFFVATLPVPILVFVYCYGHILWVIRRSRKVFSSISAGPSHNPAHGADQPAHEGSISKDEVGIIKTLVVITLLYIVCWSPNTIYFLFINIDCCPGVSMGTDVWYGTLFLVFLTICLHPFIYGTKSHAVKNLVNKIFPTHALRLATMITVRSTVDGSNRF